MGRSIWRDGGWACQRGVGGRQVRRVDRVRTRIRDSECRVRWLQDVRWNGSGKGFDDIAWPQLGEKRAVRQAEQKESLESLTEANPASPASPPLPMTLLVPDRMGSSAASYNMISSVQLPHGQHPPAIPSRS